MRTFPKLIYLTFILLCLIGIVGFWISELRDEPTAPASTPTPKQACSVLLKAYVGGADTGDYLLLHITGQDAETACTSMNDEVYEGQDFQTRGNEISEAAARLYMADNNNTPTCKVANYNTLIVKFEVYSNNPSWAKQACDNMTTE